MRIDYLTSFDRSFKKLPSSVQTKIQSIIGSFFDHLVTGIRPQGLGLRRLKGSFWEIRVGLQYRVLFELGKDLIVFVFVGNHEEVKRFLRNL